MPSLRRTVRARWTPQWRQTPRSPTSRGSPTRCSSCSWHENAWPTGAGRHWVAGHTGAWVRAAARAPRGVAAAPVHTWGEPRVQPSHPPALLHPSFAAAATSLPSTCLARACSRRTSRQRCVPVKGGKGRWGCGWARLVTSDCLAGDAACWSTPLPRPVRACSASLHAVPCFPHQPPPHPARPTPSTRRCLRTSRASWRRRWSGSGAQHRSPAGPRI